MTALRNPKADAAFRPVRHEPVSFPSAQASGLSIRKALKKLCADRLSDGVDLGHARDWIRAAAYLSALLDHCVNVQTVTARLSEFGFPMDLARRGDVLHTGWEVGAAAKAGFLTKSARIFGDLVQLTREERERLNIRCLDAIDEPAPDRRRRIKAESARRARLKAGAKPRQQSDAQTRPWEALGVGQRTWERWTAEKREAKMAAFRGATILIEEIQTHESPPSDAKFHELPPNDGERHAA